MVGIEEKINKPVDPENLTEGEKKHVPVIEAPEIVLAGEPFEVTVTVGCIPHVMEENHFIEWVELYLLDKLVERKELRPSGEEVAKVTYKVEFDKSLIAIEEFEKCWVHGVNICGNCGSKSVVTNLYAIQRCNNHGIWEAYRQIEVMSGEEKEGKKCVWKA